MPPGSAWLLRSRGEGEDGQLPDSVPRVLHRLGFAVSSDAGSGYRSRNVSVAVPAAAPPFHGPQVLATRKQAVPDQIGPAVRLPQQLAPALVEDEVQRRAGRP